MKKKARVIAFYLPQYYPIPENNKWWGNGFTEWTNVGKAKPLFRGHYQPRVPRDLGYYDLRLPEVREAQAQMARDAGIEGFMYWHYWFGNGKRLLERVFDEVLESGKPDFPFCLGWANHDWTRRSWNSNSQYSKDQELMKQLYPGDEDYISHFYYLLPAFKDKRYITVDSKPLFLIHACELIPNPQHFMELWNKLAIENGLSGIHFVGMYVGWYKNYSKVLEMGYNAMTTSNIWLAESKIDGFVWKMFKHKMQEYFLKIAPLNKYRYKDIIKHLFTDFDYLDNCYPIIMPNWDRSPRGGKRAQIYTGSTPELFKIHVLDALEIIKDKQPESKILFLRSWNEWAEGNYMEPDLKFGHGYINALKEVIFSK